MKSGFSLVYHQDVAKDVAVEILKSMIGYMLDGYNKRCGGGRTSPYRRGVLGTMYKPDGGAANHTRKLKLNETITFRRLSKNRRVFGLVPVRLLETKDGAAVDTDGCFCPTCLGSQQCRLREGFKEDEFIHYSTIGEIKG